MSRKSKSAISYLELSIVVLAADEMNYPREPALFFYCLVRLLRTSLDWSARVPCRLLDTFSDQHLEDLQRALQILHRSYVGLVAHEASCDLAGYRSPSWIRL